MDRSLPGSSLHGILQARILEWVAMPSSRDLPDSGIKPMCLLYLLHWQAGSLLLTLLAVAASLQSCPTLYDPRDGSPPGSSVLGFPRQEHWSGLPFPSPMQESEKRKWSCSVVSDSSQPHGLQSSRLLRPWEFPGKSTEVGCHCLLCYLGSPK